MAPASFRGGKTRISSKKTTLTVIGDGAAGDGDHPKRWNEEVIGCSYGKDPCAVVIQC